MEEACRNDSSCKMLCCKEVYVCKKWEAKRVLPALSSEESKVCLRERSAGTLILWEMWIAKAVVSRVQVNGDCAIAGIIRCYLVVFRPFWQDTRDEQKTSHSHALIQRCTAILIVVCYACQSACVMSPKLKRPPTVRLRCCTRSGKQPQTKQPITSQQRSVRFRPYP